MQVLGSVPAGALAADGVRRNKLSNNGFVEISVTDEGTGFSKEALCHAQERFFMGDKSRTSNMHFGMGLYITSSIIKQHGGQLVLENSKETGGAKVTMKLPC